MNKTQTILTRIFAALLGASFLWLGCLCLFDGSPFVKLGAPLVILFAALVVCVCLCLMKLFYGASFPRGARFAERAFLVLGFAAFFILQVFFGNELAVDLKDSWDFEIVASEAIKQATTGGTAAPYFSMWPNNVPVFVLLTALFKLSAAAGVYSFNYVGIYFNIVMIDLAFFVTYLTVKRLTSSRAAAFVSLFISFATLPFLSYTAIYYTDTLTLIFPILTLYLWLAAKEKLSAGEFKKAVPLLLLCAAVCAFGAQLKMTVLFAAIAVIIDALLKFAPKKALAAAGIVAAAFAVAYLSFGAVFTSAIYLPEDDGSNYIPKTHWIMMGLSGNGDYNDADYKLTLSIAPDEREAFIANEIKERIKGYGFAGMLSHLKEKNDFVWAEGSYFSAKKIDRDRLHASSLDKYLLYISEDYESAAAYQQGLLLLMLAGAVMYAASLFKKNGANLNLLPYSMCMFGLFLFLCVWEARSRYLLNYVPVFITVFSCVFFDAFKSLPARRRIKKQLPRKS